MALARQEQAAWLILLRNTQIRLYSATPGVGVGSRGLTDTFFELDLALLEEKNAGYLDLAFSSRALTKDGTVSSLLEGSRNYAVGLGDRLRERIYVEAIPELAVAVAQELERLDKGLQDMGHAYRITLRILFRLLFQAYAEDRGLLPYATNEKYRQYSLKRHARDLAGFPDKAFDTRSRTMWNELLLVWDVIDTGNTSMGVPAYNGGLFRSDPDRFPDGALISLMRLDDQVIGHALRRLLVDVDSNGVPGPVDFQSLSIREFGTIYEGLLVSSLSRADQDLTLDKKQTYVPAKAGDKVEVRAGKIYFHNTSGMRKSAGVYFTPRFAVDHLLERSLVPVLKDHLKRIGAMLDEGDVAGAYESFFDFRVCDPAMGSGNFLVAAIDYMASEMASFLAAHPIQSVTGELKRLEATARGSLGDAAELYPLEDRGLLRRQIARHCIYGIDNNDIGVELAKVAVWLHTFVPGLPMSTLDHNLVCADSLTGMESIEEAIEILDPQHKPGKVSLMRSKIEESLEKSRLHLRDAANLLEATKSEIDQADEARDRAAKAASKAKAIFDVAVVARIGEELQDKDIRMKAPDEIVSLAKQPKVSERIKILNPGHMPLLFPQVFLRENRGFDVMIGNPPWEKIKVEEHGWWGLRFPGLRSLSLEEKKWKLEALKRDRPDLIKEYNRDVDNAKKMRQIILKGPYPGMGTGDPDLFKAFSWRLWNLVRDGGAVGVVLPSGALKGKGSESWRKQVLSGSSYVYVAPLLNTGGWIFSDIHKQYIVGLVTLHKGIETTSMLSLDRLYDNLNTFANSETKSPYLVSIKEFLGWTKEAIFLLFPNDKSIDLFRKFINHSRIGDRTGPDRTRPDQTRPDQTRPDQTRPDPISYSTTLESATGGRVACHRGQKVLARQSVLYRQQGGWRVRPHRELDATRERHRFAKMITQDYWPVYGGRSFNIWLPDTGDHYASVKSEEIIHHLQQIRISKHQRPQSIFSEMPKKWIGDTDTLPCFHPRIAFRGVTNSIDSRTIIVALVPPNVVITHQAAYLLWPAGSRSDEAYLLGILSSMILDWYARRIVSTYFSFYVFESLPVPDADRNQPITQRVVELSGRLAAVDERFAEWAAEVGVPVGTLQEEPERSDAIAELDACAALLYGLDENDLRIIYDTFHDKTDYSERHAAVLAHFRRWRETL